ncbi:hypothetical protein ACOME3_006751 [Neoechinorhynchus agilis]
MAFQPKGIFVRDLQNLIDPSFILPLSLLLQLNKNTDHHSIVVRTKMSVSMTTGKQSSQNLLRRISHRSSPPALHSDFALRTSFNSCFRHLKSRTLNNVCEFGGSFS